ncbi:MAG TPA: hypothetical protein VHJ99_16310 [Candidatus Dormibacteraeota bacterium]|nr:hypothetical protein [Candidatus Dormibacteraeota bacterium]
MPASASLPHRTINCQVDPRCLEVHDWQAAGFEYYVGHDEPSALFYSKQPGSGSSSTYQLTLPTEPVAKPDPAGTTSATWDFQLHPTFWFGMILCNPDSYPNVTKDCADASDSNITPTLATAPGQAFLELQFYPPGWFPTSCTATRWCVAMVIWSLAQDPIKGTSLNSTCASKIGGIEYPNLAYLTKSGSPTAPPNPVDPNFGASFTVTNDWLLMNQGDKLTVSIHDSTHGLQTVVTDLTTNTKGSMTASAANGFGTVDYQPTGTSCKRNPYDFHPEYSTSQPPANVTCPGPTATSSGVYPNNAAGGFSKAKVCTDQGGTRVQWAAHSYNISFADEVGHFDWCNNIVEPNAGSSLAPGAGFGSGHCGVNGREGPGLTKQNDADSTNSCFTGEEGAAFAKYGGSVAGSDGPGVAIPGCVTQNDGFDGGSYQAGRWAPASNAPTPITFSSPVTGQGEDAKPYEKVAFEADIPRITALNVTDGDCSRNTGTRMTKDPVTGTWSDTGKPCAVPPINDTGSVAFYPTFGHTGSQNGESNSGGNNSCMWQFGNYTASTGGAGVQYGKSLWKLAYLAFGGGGALTYRFNDVRNVSSTTCSGGGSGGDTSAG